MNEKKANLDLALEQLKSEKFFDELYINLNSQRISAVNATLLTQALQERKCPRKLMIDLDSNQIGDEGAKAFAKALQSGKCPDGSIIDLSWNQIADEGAIAIAQALQSGKCPDRLKVYLSGNQIGDKGSMEFVQALQSKKCPDGLVIRCQNGNESLQKSIEKYNVKQKIFSYFAFMRGFIQLLIPKEAIKIIGEFVFGSRFTPFSPLVTKIFNIYEEIYSTRRITPASMTISAVKQSLPFAKNITTDFIIKDTDPQQFQSLFSNHINDSSLPPKKEILRVIMLEAQN